MVNILKKVQITPSFLFNSSIVPKIRHYPEILATLSYKMNCKIEK